MLSCWHDLLFFCLLLFYLFLLSMGRLCGVGVFGLIVFSLSPGFALRTPVNNNSLSSVKSIDVYQRYKFSQYSIYFYTNIQGFKKKYIIRYVFFKF